MCSFRRIFSSRWRAHRRAKNILGNTVGDASRLTAEGRGESDPIASNATVEGREQNRRIEIVLHRASPNP